PRAQLRLAAVARRENRRARRAALRSNPDRFDRRQLRCRTPRFDQRRHRDDRSARVAIFYAADAFLLTPAFHSWKSYRSRTQSDMEFARKSAMVAVLRANNYKPSTKTILRADIRRRGRSR